MAQAFTKALLSGDTNGKGILISATSTAGTTVHTATASTTAFDEVWLYAHNTNASSVKVTVEWGETGTAKNTVITIPADSGRFLITDGRLINNSLVVGVFAATTNVITISGFVNQIV